MNKQIERLQKWAMKLIEDDSHISEAREEYDDLMLDEFFRWLFRNVLPVLVLALIINLTIMFTVPIEVTMSKWFWLKDILSIALGYFLVKELQ